MLKFLSHRGLWEAPSEKNTLEAFQRSFDAGFGIETDIRDYAGQLVLSHDVANASAISLQKLLDLPGALESSLALNIKADGLADMLQHVLLGMEQLPYFFFDMSLPDMKEYMQRGLPVYARMSEVEPRTAWIEQCAGVWLDAFSSIWYDGNDISSLVDLGKKICVVSEELHGRNAEEQWKMLLVYRESTDIMLCTDNPTQAKAYFGVSHD